MTTFAFFRSRLATIRSWSVAVAQRRRLEAEMEGELAEHLALRTSDLMSSGLSPDEAARRARLELGNPLTHKEGMRSALGLRWLDEFWADLRFGARILRKSPGFTAIAVTSLALAIGANTTIFSVARQVLYERLNVPNPAGLRMLRWNGDRNSAVQMLWGNSESRDGGGQISPDFSYPVYRQLRAHNQALEDLFAFKGDMMNATVRGNAQRLRVEMVSGNYYAQLGVQPQLGRPIQPSDDLVVGSGTVALISDGLWEREFSRSAAALGQTIKVNDAVFTIVGVNPRGFTGAENTLSSPDVFMPLSMQPVVRPMRFSSTDAPDSDLRKNPELWWLEVMGRVKPGVKDREAQAALGVQLSAAVRSTLPVKADESVPHLEFASGARGMHFSDWAYKKPVDVLMALVALVLLLACSNTANLLLAMGSRRQREMSVRLALGAGRRRILRQMLVESLLLSTMAGAGGLVLGYLGRNTIPRLLTHGWQNGEIDVAFDWRVFAFTAAVTIATGILFGLAPAWMAARSEVSGSLKESAHTATKRRRGLGGKGIVAFQIALSTLLVIGAGLFLRTLLALNSVDLGFNSDHLLLFDINLPTARYPAGKDVQTISRLEQRFAALPGVDRVTPMWEAYISDSMSNLEFLPEGETANQKNGKAEYINLGGIDFFKTLEIPIVAGRAFGPEDTATSEKVAVINESLARKRFPGINPIGKRFKAPDLLKDDWVRVVGICADTHYDRLQGNPPAQFILPYVQQPEVRNMTFAIRSRMAPAALVPSLRQVVQQADRDLPVINIRTQREQIEETTQTERTFAALTSGCGLLALVLACVGIYGIMAYSVANRRNEIGIRLALGAQPGQVRGMVLRESTGLALAGIIVGVAAALGLARLVKSMLYGIQPYDPATLAGGVFVLLAVALAASWIPARRAAGVQPMEALRHE